MPVFFVISVIFQKPVHYNRENLLVKDVKPNQEVEFICYDLFAISRYITMIVITEFDCI
jgi:hypothetical protein